MDDGAFADLRLLHLELDRAVVAAYGWPAVVAQDDLELVRLLTERNREVAAGALVCAVRPAGRRRDRAFGATVRAGGELRGG